MSRCTYAFLSATDTEDLPLPAIQTLLFWTSSIAFAFTRLNPGYRDEKECTRHVHACLRFVVLVECTRHVHACLRFVVLVECHHDRARLGGCVRCTASDDEVALKTLILGSDKGSMLTRSRDPTWYQASQNVAIMIGHDI
jgi:hypothetical protein